MEDDEAPQETVNRKNHNRSRSSHPVASDQNKENSFLRHYFSSLKRKLSSTKAIQCQGIIIIETILMTIGIIVVCLTSRKTQSNKCEPTLSLLAELSKKTDSHPKSIAAGDFNNDAWIDFVVANTDADTIGVFLSNGGGSFQSQTEYSTGLDSLPCMTSVGDFNNDSRLDIIVANFATNSIGLFLGYGNGTFANQIMIRIGSSRPQWLVAVDLNKDNKLDIVIANYGTDNIGVLFGSGNGTFTRYITLSTGYDSNPVAVAIGDFNNDNIFDLVSVNYGIDNVGIFLGSVNGTFNFRGVYTTGLRSGPVAAAVSDLNNDAKQDIAIAAVTSDRIMILLGLGDGIIEDVNGDKIPDMAVTNKGTSVVGVFWGYGNGSFADQIMFSTGPQSSPNAIVVTDFNNDLILDIAVVNQKSSNVMILSGLTDQTFAPQIVYSPSTFYYTFDSPHYIDVKSAPDAIALGDFNNDGFIDFVVPQFNNDTITIFLGNGDGTFTNGGSYVIGPLNSGPSDVGVGDFDIDGFVDVVVANFYSDEIVVFFGHSNGTFSSPSSYLTGSNSQPRAIGVADLNGDTYLDIVVVNSGTDCIGVFIGVGGGSFSSQTTYSTGDNSRPVDIAIADLDSNNIRDIIVANSAANTIGVFIGYGNGSFSSQQITSTGDGSQPIAVAIGDLNADSKNDIAVCNNGTSSVVILFGYGDGTFPSLIDYSTGDNSSPSAVALSDFNKDGRLDLAIVNYLTNSVGVFIGNVFGSFSSQKTFTMNMNSGPVAIAIHDFNNDNTSDIAVVNSASGSVAIFLERHDRVDSFTAYQSVVNRQPGSVVSHDFNGDGRLDVAVAYAGSGSIGTYFGYGDGSFRNGRSYLTGVNSWPSAIISADFNRDNRLDLAVANRDSSNIGVLFGNGNGTFADQITFPTNPCSDPKSLSAADFNSDGILDIIVVSSISSKIILLFGRSDVHFSAAVDLLPDSSVALMMVAVDDINNDNRVDFIGPNYSDNMLVYFLGYGNGSFQAMKTLSTGVATSPVVLVVADFNNDQKLDLAVLNTFISEEHVLIFMGSGDGNFSTLGRYVTGVNSEPKAIIAGDFNKDNQIDIAVANSANNNIGIFLGFGNGTFSDEKTYMTGAGSKPSSIAIGDFNADKLTDMAVVNYEPSTMGIFLAFINHSFQYTTTHSTGSAASPTVVAAGHFTNDDEVDIVIANAGMHNIDVLFRLKNSSSLRETIYSGNYTFFPADMVIVDFNNDSYADIAIVDALGESVSVLFSSENRKFVNHSSYSVSIGSNPKSLASGNFNQDHRMDIVVTQSGIGSINVLLHGDSGALKNLKTLSTGTGSKPHGLALGDFDNDGWLDIVVANNGLHNIGFFYGLGDGTFSEQIVVQLPDTIYPQSVSVANFNNDTLLDVAVTSNWGPGMVFLFGVSNRTFLVQFYSIQLTWSIVVRDFNNDGCQDVAVGHAGSTLVSTLLGHCDGSFETKWSWNVEFFVDNHGIDAGDFNQDRYLDLAVATANENCIQVVLGFGNGAFSSPKSYGTGLSSAPFAVVTNDLNSDGYLDLIVANYGTNCLSVLFGYENATFSKPTVLWSYVNSHPSWLALGDFNKDGRTDIAVVYNGASTIGILLRHVNSTFFNEITYAVGSNVQPWSLAAGDFNNDGRLDVVFSKMLTDSVGVFLGYATDSFLILNSYKIGDSSIPEDIGVGDFNNDTLLDVAITDTGTNELVILYGAGYGYFNNQARYSTGKNSQPNSIEIDDFNQDHILDIVVANILAGTIIIFLGNSNGTFSAIASYSTGDLSSPLSLAIGFFDNDAFLDLAVGDYGSSRVALFYGYGNGSFAAASFFASGFGAKPFSIAFGNRNAYNCTNIFIANNGYSSIDILSRDC